jgi:hypothetical protein
VRLADLEKLRGPQIEQDSLFVPILNEEKSDKTLGPDSVIEYLIGAKGPSRDGKVVYCAPDVVEPSEAVIFHKWEQAWAVWRKYPVWKRSKAPSTKAPSPV